MENTKGVIISESNWDGKEVIVIEYKFWKYVSVYKYKGLNKKKLIKEFKKAVILAVEKELK